MAPDHERTTVRLMCVDIESRGRFAWHGRPIGRRARGHVGRGFGIADIMFDQLDLGVLAGSEA